MEITLKEGCDFQKGCYYILKDYDTDYRNPEYNSVSYDVFTADKTQNSYSESGKSFGNGNLGNIHIQKADIEIKGNQIILTVTPESEATFEIVEYNPERLW